LLALAAVTGLTTTGTAGESPSDGVVDSVGLFRPTTIDRADKLISELKRQYRFDVRVETLQLSDVERKKVEGLSLRRAKGRYFVDLGRQRAEEAHLDGLYVLICTSPRYVQVTVAPRSAESLFSGYQQRQLQKTLEKGLQGVRPEARLLDAAAAAVGIGWRMRPPAGPDATLVNSLNEVESVLRSQAGDPNALRASTLGAILATGLGLWALLGLVSRRMADRNPQDGLLRPGERHLTPVLLAARFGTPTGYWLYDRMFQNQNRTVAPQPLATVSQHTQRPAEAHDRVSTIVPSASGHAGAAPNDEPVD
jgi:hypothetical protein